MLLHRNSLHSQGLLSTHRFEACLGGVLEGFGSSLLRHMALEPLQVQVGPVGLEPTTRGLKEGAVSYAEANRDAPIRTAYGR